MFATVALLCSIWGTVQSSGLHPVAPAGVAPIVTAASSQYFERTFNRLVAATPVFEPVFPVASAPLPPPFAVAPLRPILPAFPVASDQPEVVDAIRTTSIPLNPTDPPQTDNSAEEPNVAIAIATAQAAAPVATILLPPYPFGFPPSFGLIPQPPQVPSENPNQNRETTTRKSTTTPTTTERQQENITPAPSNIDTSFAQALPSVDNINFKQYYGPPAAAFPGPKPQKLRTTVEVVPVPLRYIAPPPLNSHHHHQHHHHHHHHQAIKAVPHFHTFIPKSHKIIIRPISGPLRTRTTRIPAGLVTYGPPKLVKKISQNYSQNIRLNPRDIEPTTFRPINKPISKSPRV